MNYQRAEAQSEGENRIFPGKRIVIKAVDSRFSGTWLVERVVHDIGESKGGFTTTVYLKRNKSGDDNDRGSDRSVSAIDAEMVASEEGEGERKKVEERKEKKASSSSGAGTSSAPQKKNLSEMSDEELEKLGYKRHSDGSIRDSKGHFAGNSGVIPGTPGVDAAKKYLTENGYELSGEEISVKSSDGKIRRYDIVAKKGGVTYGIEVKSGSATRTKQQKLIDEELMKLGGLKTVGAKADANKVDKIDSVKLIRVDKDGKIIEDI